jgi:hypothetical protein
MGETANRLPRWRGSNLLEMFTARSEGDFQEGDFRRMSDLKALHPKGLADVLRPPEP